MAASLLPVMPLVAASRREEGYGMAGPTASHATDTAAHRDKAQGCLGTVSHG